MSMRMEGMALEPGEVPRSPLAGRFTLGAVGDLIYLRPMARTLRAQQPGLLRELARADVLFGNLETAILDIDAFDGAPQAESGGTWMHADPRVADDLRALGFSVVGLANNHATDWGTEGLLETVRRLDRAGLPSAGAGRTSSGARAATYLDVEQGRIAVLAATATFTPMSPAADPFGRVPARAGISVLRTVETSVVSPQDYAMLTRLAAAGSYSNSIREGSLRLMGGEFVADESLGPGEVRIEHRTDESDAAEILTAIRQARQNSSFVVFSFHSHEPDNGAQPAPFAAEFARRAVDAGADVVVGHGPHQLRGIELYRGAPIFHSLGNFAMMSNSLDVVTRDTYRLYGADPADVTVPELLSARNATIFADPVLDEALLPLLHYDEGELTEIELLPLDLGRGTAGAAHGTPRLAAPAVAEPLLERVAALSAPFATRLTLLGDRAAIRLSMG
ncbi:CapA family protein [Streptomyces shenzhenensis]|uniref:CapA family protein n=1 Tax=Streptomyces shenzhenensis TaxID=943815 RepID=UPI0038052782